MARVAQDAILASQPRNGVVIRVTMDTAGYGDQAEVEVRRAGAVAQLRDLVAVVGHGGSRASLAAAPVYADARIPQIVPTGTSRLLRSAGPWTLPLAPDDSIEGAFMGRFIAQRLRARAVAIFYQNDEYGRGLRDGVVAELERRDVHVLFESPVDARSDLGTLLDASLLAGRSDVVIAATQAVVAGRLMRLASQRIPGVRMVAGDGALLLPVLADSAGAAADSIYCVSFWHPDGGDARTREFVERFRRVTGVEPVGSDALLYDALMLAAAAVRTVGTRREAVRGYLRSLGRERPPYPGITGPVSFQPDRAVPLVMVRLAGGVPARVSDYR